MMDNFFSQLLLEGFYLILLLTAPILFVSLVVGIVFSVLQSLTQIQEHTLSFVPKFFAVGITLWMMGEWIQEKLVQYTQRVWEALQFISL